MAAKSSYDPDHALAILLQAQFNEEIKKSKRKDKENVPVAVKNSPHSSLADPEWEVTDPCPNIHALFIAFNTRFFWGKLGGVEVKWSPQMTSCAGVCVYQGQQGLCSVRLSAPLLKLRPRSDLVETLLHEMIHAYLFVTNNNRDRDGHGPEFHKHMDRINKEAGVNITVYHSFHAEVKLYKQHWWRCNGECQRHPPFYGMVKRARNRAPGPNDLWWDRHRAQCSGQFIKVREPDGYSQKKTKQPADLKTREGKDIRSFYNTVPETLTSNDSKVGSNIFGFNNMNNKSKGSFIKPSSSGGNDTNRVVGFVDLSSPNKGKGKPTTPFGKASGGYVLGGGNAKNGQSKPGPVRGGMLANRGGGTLVVSSPQQKNKPQVPSPNTNLKIDTFRVFSGSGKVVGSSLGHKDKSKSRLLNNIATPEKKKRKTNEDGEWEDFGELLSKPEKPESCVKCVICNKSTSRDEMDMHLESCLSALNILDENNGNTDFNVEDNYEKWKVKYCPVCGLNVDGDVDTHVNECLDSSGILNLLDDPDMSIEASGDVPKPIVNTVAGASDGDVEIIEPEARVSCPICGLRYGESRINGHVNQCLDTEFAGHFS